MPAGHFDGEDVFSPHLTDREAEGYNRECGDGWHQAAEYLATLEAPTAPDPWAIGTPITVDHPLHATVAAWESIEATLTEWRIPDPEPRAKAIMARLARLDPPVLVCHPSEMKE